jgi:voltage-gated potassium channel
MLETNEAEIEPDPRAERLMRLERWTDWPLTFLALLLIPILIAPHVAQLSPQSLAVLDGIDYLIWGIFAADFAAKLIIAPRRIGYIRHHWFDVILVALPVLRPVRAVRSVRALRLMRAGRAVAALMRILIITRSVLARHSFHYVLLVVVLFILTGGSLVVEFEKDAPDANIHTIPDGLWWAITTTTTVGYGDTFPKTAAGRGIGVVLMIVGIGLFGVLTANLSAYFVEQQEESTVDELRRLRQDIARLEAKFDGLQE